MSDELSERLLQGLRLKSEQTPPPEPGKTSIRLGAAFLRVASERGHYELMRPAITVKNEGDRVVTEAHGDPVGPLAMYRRKGPGDVCKYDAAELMARGGPPTEMKTMDPQTKEPMQLILVWWPGGEA